MFNLWSASLKERISLVGSSDRSLFVMANPTIPGAPYHLIHDLLNSCGGSSRELEDAAEVGTFTTPTLLVIGSRTD